MLDFVQVRTATKPPRKDGSGSMITIYPEYIVGESKDLMIRGGAFYAVWDESTGYWTKDASVVARLVDEALAEKRDEYPDDVVLDVRWLRVYSTKKWDEFLSYCRSLPDNFVELDSSVTFADDHVEKSDYVTKRLPYPLKPGNFDAYEELMSTLYEPIERKKIEWAIGSIISGDSKHIQKFIVLYGSAGSGKSTVLNIVQMLFDGYYNVFEAKSLTSSGNNFALEMFRDNPLVSVQHDGDLSRIEDNTKLNSIVSHEEMVVNEKRKAQYVTYFRSFLFMGTNKPVRITDSKSGITRRLIDVKPSGRLVPFGRYQVLMAQIRFELGAIASHCLDVYLQAGMNAYDTYRPLEMMGATNDFFNFVEDNYDVMRQPGGITLAQVWAMYKRWAEDAAVKYPMSRRAVKEELKGYFREFSERQRTSDGSYIRNVYAGFEEEKLGYSKSQEPGFEPPAHTLAFDLRSDVRSRFDDAYSDAPAQLATASGTPSFKWADVKTVLSDIDTSELHYVKVPENHIVIDFDLRGADGEKNLEMNIEAASKWPTTYTELSQSGKGVHLHYFYDGDTSKLSPSYSEGIEVKVFRGNSSLRRKLTRCNDARISTISSGLPLKKGGKKMMDFDGFKDEKHLRALIVKNLKKQVHPGTKPSIDFIYKILEDAYASGIHYDVTDMRQDILVFANNSTHHSLYCVKLVNKMKFHSEDPSPSVPWEDERVVFYDIEVFPNLFVVCWKEEGSDKCNTMINPSPSDIQILMNRKLVGFNNRRYDNHLIYARLLGYDNAALYGASQKIISGSRNAMFREAYGISYADVYDFCSKKQSLKKWEIELGIHHQELGLPWDEPVPRNLWEKVASYCENDVRATEAVFKARFADFQARELLSDLSGLTVNDTTRQHAARIIFDGDRNPQSKFVYTDLSTIFEGYKFEYGKSTYRGEEVGEGGYVFSIPGYYENVDLEDIESMHPRSIDQLNLFGPYTQNFRDLLNARLMIKHKDYESAAKVLDGKLAPYLTNPDDSGKLAYALKIIINSIYGLTAARFDCEFKDPRNIDNIVAKRGSLFMVDLKNAIQEKGYTVAHIKTDSVKIPNSDPDIRKFVHEFGKKYGYTFDHEATYEKLVLVNDTVYICRDTDGEWHATGPQFAVPYVFKTLFSKEDIRFEDLCETKSVTGESAIVLDMNESLEEGEHDYRFVGRAGSFCPVVDGANGGQMMRMKDGKYYAVTGTKGYRWMESEVVKALGREDAIDYSYFDRLVDEAKRSIERFVPYEELVK